MKYDPKKALNKPLLEDEQEEKDLSEPVSQNIEKKVGFKDFQKIKYSQEAEESDYSESEPKDQNKPTFNFLKRKSQTYKPTKLEWKAKTRINCWGETVTPEVKKKVIKKPKIENFKSNQISTISFTRILELEGIFSQLSNRFVSVSAHFGVPERMINKSKIPQFQPFSDFVTRFKHDMYQDTFEALQTHYLYLCNEEDMG